MQLPHNITFPPMEKNLEALKIWANHLITGVHTSPEAVAPNRVSEAFSKFGDYGNREILLLFPDHTYLRATKQTLSTDVTGLAHYDIMPYPEGLPFTQIVPSNRDLQTSTYIKFHPYGDTPYDLLPEDDRELFDQIFFFMQNNFKGFTKLSETPLP